MDASSCGFFSAGLVFLRGGIFCFVGPMSESDSLSEDCDRLDVTDAAALGGEGFLVASLGHSCRTAGGAFCHTLSADIFSSVSRAS